MQEREERLISVRLDPPREPLRGLLAISLDLAQRVDRSHRDQRVVVALEALGHAGRPPQHVGGDGRRRGPACGAQALGERLDLVTETKPEVVADAVARGQQAR